jgi:hypothetical protein
MLPYRDTRLTRILLGIFFLIVICYAYFEARGLLFGPSISFSSATPSNVQESYVLIEGRATHIASLSVNGEAIQVTQAGAFEEPYVLAPGDNRIVFDAKDKYGHATEKVLEIVYTPSATSTSSIFSTQTSTSTATSTTGTPVMSGSTSASSSPAIAPGH